MLLATKCFIPAVRSEFVARPRLMEKLDAGLMGRLTLVAAPAGFGKSTLVSHWLQERHLGGYSWLSLDEGDNDLACFWGYLYMAVQKIAPQLGDSLAPLLQIAPLPPPDILMTALINDLSRLETDGHDLYNLLVLDDYHLIENELIHQALIFLLENGPPHFHLVLSSRADPPLPLARWRVRRQLTELRADDLRFTREEAAAFLNDRMGLDLSPAQIGELERRTEGWAAALQLATVSMQDRDDLAGFIESFSGSHYFVLDYLTDEVLHKQPAPRRDFLLRTSILERFCAPLCAALLTTTDETTTESMSRLQDVLEELEQANLFVVRLDDERNWYRYHHLFAEFLRKRLHDELTPLEHQVLCRRAANWCDAQGHDEEAIQYALQSGDELLITDLMRKYVQITMGRSELHKILRWLEAMQQAGLPLTPQFKIWHAWAMLFSGQTEKLATVLAELESTTATAETEEREIAGNLAALRGWLALFQGDLDQTIDLVSQALDELPLDDLYVRGTCYLNLGYAYLLQSNLRGAVQGFTEALAASERSGNLITAVFARTYLANAQVQRGDLYMAEQGYRHAIAQATEHHQLYSPATGVAYIGLSELLREWNRLDESAELIDRAIELLQKSRNNTMLNQALSAKVRTQIARGEIQAALETLQTSDEIARSIGQVQSPEVSDTLRVRINLRFGDAEAAYRWAASQTLPDLQTQVLEGYRTALALGAIWGIESPAQARRGLSLLARLRDVAQTAGFFNVVLQSTILQAVAYQTLGDKESALTHLESALAQAESQGYMAQFISIGAPMRQLLHLALRRDLYAEYVHRLLAAFPPDESSAATPIRSPQSAQPLIEPLSGRELEVLALLAAGSSNAEIAQRLIITVGTVKRHVSNIYGKLGVGSRTQAVAHAREIGLL